MSPFQSFGRAPYGIAGVDEILVRDTYGLSCKIGDPADMADKILRMLTDQDLYEHYRRQGQIRIQDFSYESIRCQLEHILTTLK